MSAQSQTVTVGIFCLLLGTFGGVMAGRFDHHTSDPVDNHATGGMHHTMDSMNAALKGKSGAEFDKTFLQEMIVHHEGAVDMSAQVLARSERQELKDFAQRIISAQKAEIEQMKRWQSEWFNAR